MCNKQEREISPSPSKKKREKITKRDRQEKEALPSLNQRKRTTVIWTESDFFLYQLDPLQGGNGAQFYRKKDVLAHP